MIVIRNVTTIAPHATQRMKERVMPWADTWSHEALRFFIRQIVVDRVHSVVKGSPDGRFVVENPYLRFVYQPEDRKIQTILPFHALSKEDVAKIKESRRYGHRGDSD